MVASILSAGQLMVFGIAGFACVKRREEHLDIGNVYAMIPRGSSCPMRTRSTALYRSINISGQVASNAEVAMQQRLSRMGTFLAPFVG